MQFKIKIILALLLISFISCTITELENKEPKIEDLTYSIESITEVSAVDLNSNGFSSRMQFTMNVKIAENYNRDIQTTIYYRNADSTDFKFYTYLANVSITGNNADNQVPFELSSFQKALPRGVYDFKIEIGQSNYDRIEASISPDDENTPVNIASILTGHSLEQFHTDVTYTLNVSWNNKHDRTENDAPRSAELTLDFNMNDTITAPLSANIYKKLTSEDESSFVIYKTIEEFTISSDAEDDSINIDIGTTFQELQTGKYDFKVDLLDGNFGFLIQSFFNDTDSLKEKNFESLDDDTYFYSINDIFWSDSLDMNGNEWHQSRELNIDIDVDKNHERELIIEFFIKPEDSNDFKKYGNFGFTITGKSPADVFNFEVKLEDNITSSSQSLCDFMLNLYEKNVADTARAIEATADPSTYENVFSQQKFESKDSDINK